MTIRLVLQLSRMSPTTGAYETLTQCNILYSKPNTNEHAIGWKNCIFQIQCSTLEGFKMMNPYNKGRILLKEEL